MQETRCFPTTRRDRYWIELHEIKQDIVRKKLHLKNTKGFQQPAIRRSFFLGRATGKEKAGKKVRFQPMDWTMLPYEQRSSDLPR